MGTLFSEVYNRFLLKITDDMYMELTPEDTIRDLQNLLINAIPYFEFPRKVLTYYTISVEEMDEADVTDRDFVIGVIWNELPEDESKPARVYVERSYFNDELTTEEINILAIIMKEGWLNRQVASIENTRMKYSGSDFKMTSQANHLSKLQNLLSEVQREGFHMQRLYKRRKIAETGHYVSNWSVLREVSALD